MYYVYIKILTKLDSRTIDSFVEPPVQIKKLTSVHDILSQGAVHKWKQLGLQLGLKESKLDTISADYKDDPEENMTKVFKLWKTQSLQPTWKNLIAAIEQTRLNLQLSQTLRNLHQKGQFSFYTCSIVSHLPYVT